MLFSIISHSAKTTDPLILTEANPSEQDKQGELNKALCYHRDRDVTGCSYFYA